MIFLALLIILSATPINEPSTFHSYFIVWNVGQGQWNTWVQKDRCLHFDIGGETFPWKKAKALCGDKPNEIYLSHWDWDHIGGLSKAKIFLPKICLRQGPIGESTPRKQALLPKPCEDFDKNLKIWKWQPKRPPKTGSQTSKMPGSNELSQVFIANSFLLPGDSTKKQELQWAALLPKNQVHILLLGHHGSRTSTSDFLLRQIPQAQQAISSARWPKYKHPHAETLALLKKYRIPLLRTEDWGSLWFE